MASNYEFEVTLASANNLKNVNWRHGPNRPYAVVWVDPSQKSSTNADADGDTEANWDETLVIPSPPGPIQDFTLFVDILHAEADPDTKPLIGSATLSLSEVFDDVGTGKRFSRTLKLKRPSGRPQGTVDVRVIIRDTGYRARAAYDAPSYAVPPPVSASRDFPAPLPAYGYASNAPPPSGNQQQSGYGAPISYGQPSYGYGQGAQPGYGYGQGAQPSYGYGQGAKPGYGYGQGAQPGYEYGQSAAAAYTAAEEKKSKSSGMMAGLAIGALAGGLGAIALEKGLDIIEDEIADRAAEKVEEDLGYDF